MRFRIASILQLLQQLLQRSGTPCAGFPGAGRSRIGLLSAGRSCIGLLSVGLFSIGLLLAVPRAAFAVPPTADAGGPYFANLGDTISFDGSASFDPEAGALTYLWEFGDGATGTGVQPTHTYATVGGLLIVTLTVTDEEELTDADTVGAVINQPPTADPNGPYEGVPGEAVLFDGSGSTDPDGNTLSYDWEFGDGNAGSGVTPTHTYLAGGAYTVTLTVEDPGGLTSSAATVATINEPPVADAGGPYAGNQGAAISFDGSGSFDPEGATLTFLWQFGDGQSGGGETPSHTYTTGGSFMVTLTVTDDVGLQDFDATQAVVNRPPVAQANGPYSGNQGATISFSGSGTFDPDGGPLTYVWDFGDGDTALGPSPTHVYAVGGDYIVTLTVTDDEGLSDSDTAPADINRPPEAEICGTSHLANQGEPYPFDGTCSSDPDGDTLSFEWNFGDGSNGSGPTPTHVYTGGGPYTVTLTVRDAGNMSDQHAVTVAINHPPTADAGGPYAGALGETIHFHGSGSDPDGGALTFEWQFGDGATASGANPVHVYTAGGTFVVTLTVRDNGGLTGSDQTEAVINWPPTAVAGGPYAANPGVPIQFDGTDSSDPEGGPLTYEWDFGDSRSGSGPTPVHIYESGGNYIVTLTVRDPGGLEDDDATPASINSPPVAAAGGPYAANAGAVIIFDGRGSDDPDGDELVYLWDFGDGTTGFGPQPSKQYATGDVYNVTLLVTDTGGLSDTDGTTADINGPPTAVAGGPYAGNEGESIQFDGSDSSDPDGDPLTYTWNFGDGMTGSGRSPTHVYAAGGDFTVTLTVRDPGGMESTDGTTAVVNRTPTANAGGPYSTNVGESIQFDGSASSDPESAGLVYAWEFGDGTTAGGVAPAHTYAASGNYTVTLTVTDPGGLFDTAEVGAIVNGPPIAVAGGPYAGNMGFPVAFDGTGSFDPDGDPISYLWEFGDGATAAGAEPTHIYLLGGIYTVTLTVTDPDLLTGVSVTSADINAAPTANPGGPYAGNEGAEIQFDGSASSDPDGDALNYFWNFGDGGQGLGVAPIHVYEVGGRSYTVTLIVVDPEGLSHQAETTVLVNGRPVASAGGPYDANEGETIQFDATASTDPEGGPLTYFWEFGDGGIASGPLPTHVYAAPALGLYTVMLTVTDPLEFTDTVMITVPINRAPLADSGGPYEANEGESVQFDATGTVDPDPADELVYAWEFGDGATAGGPLPIHVYEVGAAEPYTVTLTVTDPSGLFAEVATTADINRGPTADAGPPAPAERYEADINTEMTFDGTASSDPDGDVLIYEWEFGDGASAGGVGFSQPDHTYTAAGGLYTVTLTVRDMPSASGQSGGVASVDVTEVLVHEIIVTSPGGDDVWSEGSDQTISWQIGGEIPEEVRVEFRRGANGSWTLLGRVPAASGEFDWSPVSPVTRDEPGSRVRVVRPATVHSPQDLVGLSAPFTLENREIDITAPGSGVEIFETAELLVAWDWRGYVPTVDLYVRYPGGNWEEIPGGQGIENDGDFRWPVPENNNDQFGVEIRVRNAEEDDDGTLDVSAPFTILDRELGLQHPEPGDVWSEASRREIIWRATGPFGDVRVEYRIGFGGDWHLIDTVPAADESYHWVLPPVERDESGSRVRIKEADPGQFAESDQSADFIIQNRVIEVTAPVADDEISERTETVIRWSSVGFIEEVRLQYALSDPPSWVTITSTAPNDPGLNQYTWTTPEVDLDEPGVRVRVSDANSAADQARDESGSFTLINRTLALTAPTEFSEWCEADTVAIVWSSTGYIPGVGIDWRPSSDEGWESVVDDTPDTGSYVWLTPDLPETTDEAQIRIRNTADRDVTDRSPAFRLNDRLLDLLQPAGGDTVSEGDGEPLRWNQVCLDSVKIWVRLRESADWISQGVWNASLLQIVWPVPAVDSTENGVQLRITDASDPGQVFDLSEAFTIINKRLAVIRPTVTDSLSEMQPFLIEWDSQGSLQRVDIDFRLSPLANWQEIAREFPNAGEYEWVLPLVDTDYTAAQVRVSDSFTSLEDESEPFAIFNRVLAVDAPAAGDSLSEAASTVISWSTRGYVPLVRIDYRAASSEAWQLVVDELPNVGSYPWLVPDVDGDALAAQVRVVDVSAPEVEAESLLFTVIDRVLVVLAPTAGDVWSEATTESVRWQWAGLIDSVRIDYRETTDGAWLPVAGPIENLGAYDWELPEVEERRTQAEVRVADAGAPSVVVLSVPFTFENRMLTIASPAPVERSAWRLGTIREVRWTSTGFIPQVDVELSRDGADGAYVALATGIDNTGTLTWELTGPESYDAYFRVRDAGAEHVIGISPHPVALFDLQPPARCGDFDHDDTVDLDEVMRIEGIIVGTAVPAASQADSVNLDCHADGGIDLNDLLGAVDAMLVDAAAGRGRSAGGRFEDGGGGAPVTIRIGEESVPGGAVLAGTDGRRLAVPLRVEASEVLAGVLIEVQVIGAGAEPRLAGDGWHGGTESQLAGNGGNGDDGHAGATLAWTSIDADPSRFVVILRAGGSAAGLATDQLADLTIELEPEGGGQVSVRLLRAEAYDARLGALPVHLAGEVKSVVPLRLSLGQNVPNPFNPMTEIRFGLPGAGPVRLDVYDVAGRLVRRLLDGELPAGFHTARWDGRDQRGAQVASGIYLYTLQAPGGRETRKMTLLH